MSMIRELVFDWLFNASLQIGLFAILGPYFHHSSPKPKRSINITSISQSLPSV